MFNTSFNNILTPRTLAEAFLMFDVFISVGAAHQDPSGHNTQNSLAQTGQQNLFNDLRGSNHSPLYSKELSTIKKGGPKEPVKFYEWSVNELKDGGLRDHSPGYDKKTCDDIIATIGVVPERCTHPSAPATTATTAKAGKIGRAHV